ncbi:MAG: hypothetical protein DWI26_05720 [Planctomycetota bacterium]|nr:MAG: hypothetical protein DWI26_05720 [Planctomycetota bacterium]
MARKKAGWKSGQSSRLEYTRRAGRWGSQAPGVRAKSLGLRPESSDATGAMFAEYRHGKHKPVDLASRYRSASNRPKRGRKIEQLPTGGELNGQRRENNNQ